jgi:hypothetical protein
MVFAGLLSAHLAQFHTAVPYDLLISLSIHITTAHVKLAARGPSLFVAVCSVDSLNLSHRQRYFSCV